MKYIRIISLVLVVTFLLAAFSSCKVKEETPEQTSGAGETEAQTDKYRDDIPRDLLFSGETVSILWRGLDEQYSNEKTGDKVSEAMYNRDRDLSDRFNIKINNVGKDYTFDTRDQYVSAITSSVMSGGEDSYDIVSGHYLLFQGLVAGGYLSDLNSMKYLDFDKPWYAKGLAEETSIGGKLYAITGDINATYISDIYCMYFNNPMISSKKLEDPRQLVSEKKWTVEKMKTMIKDTWDDRDGNGEVTKSKDGFGLCIPSANHLTAWMTASGAKLTEMYNNYPRVVCNTPKVTDLVEEMKGLVYSNRDVVFYNNDNGETYTTLADDFSSKYLFAEDKFAAAKNLCAANKPEELIVGILPMPMYDSEQDGYYTTLGEQNNMFAIPMNVASEDLSAAVLEAMSAYSYEYVSSTYYEKQLKLRYSADSEMSAMFDLIRSGVVIGFGNLYGYNMNFMSVWFKDCIAKNKNLGWTTYLSSRQSTAEKQMQQFYDEILSKE